MGDIVAQSRELHAHLARKVGYGNGLNQLPLFFCDRSKGSFRCLAAGRMWVAARKLSLIATLTTEKAMNFVRRLLVGAAALTVVATGVFAADANVSGEWDMSVQTQAGSGSPHFSLKQEGTAVTGSYKGQLGEAPVTGTVKGNEVSLTYKVSGQGQELVVTYTGTVEGNTIKGKVSMGELGEGTFTGKKA